MFDYKITSPKLHKQYTSVDNRLIQDNFKYLYSIGKEIILRCPIIPDYNDDDEHFNGIAYMEKNYPLLAGIEIMPYHNLGKDKARAIDKSYEVTGSTADNETKERWKEKLSQSGCSQAIIDSF